jgi:hypothetical protein
VTPAASEPEVYEEEWPADSMPAQTPAEQQSGTPHVSERPTDTSGFFAARAQAVGNGVPAQLEPASEPEPAVEPEPEATPATGYSDADGSDDAIYQKMLSEWLVDPSEFAKTEDLNWESVWDHGWSVAAAADEAPVVEHTDDGLPVRQPGARLVPGAAPSAETGHPRNGGAHRSSEEGDQENDEVASAAQSEAGGQHSSGGGEPVPHRDPDAVRASIRSHFGGVHVGRSHARDTRGTDSQ